MPRFLFSVRGIFFPWLQPTLGADEHRSRANGTERPVMGQFYRRSRISRGRPRFGRRSRTKGVFHHGEHGGTRKREFTRKTVADRCRMAAAAISTRFANDPRSQ